MLKRLFTWVLLLTSAMLQAQHIHTDRCGTGKVMEAYFQQFPQYRKPFEERLDNLRKQAVQRKDMQAEARVQASMQVPVVFHVLLPNPALVTDAQLLGQLKTINDDFGGTNADSTAIPAAFKNSFGKSCILFCMAQRTPENEPSSGIIRKTFTNGSSPGLGDPAKYTALGGSDAWDTNRFLNIWVTEIGGGTLGYSFLPGTPGLPAREAGLVLNYRYTGNSGTATAPFNLGRTATHELGHFFGLQHIWGASENTRSCSDSDGVSDTPNQDTANFGNPVFPKTDACTPSAPGVMFMNYMDYVNDAAMMMFTQGQAALMETALANASDRAGLLQSDGCTHPVVYPLDARLAGAVNMAEGAFLCTGTFTPSIVVRNAGSTTLTTVSAGYILDGGLPQTNTFSINLASYTQTTVALAPIDLQPGAHTIVLFVYAPNGNADNNLTNDTLRFNFTVNAPVNLPITESFESGMLPDNWYLRTSGQTNWQLTNMAGNTGSQAMYFPNFDTDEPGSTADLVLPSAALNGADSIALRFSVAAAIYNTTYLDTLQVLVSTDCGTTFTSVYKKWGNTLATAPATSDAFFPTATQWREEHIDLSNFRNSGTIQVFFRNINQFGNNIFLDDISLNGFNFPENNAALSAINDPAERLCSPDIVPKVTIRNEGIAPLQSLSITFRTDNGTETFFQWTGFLERFQTEVVTLPAAAVTTGTHELVVYTSFPNGNPDPDQTNDTLRKTFVRQDPVALPLTESFEQPGFPPPNWFLATQDNNTITWALSPLAAYTGTRSAVAANASAQGNAGAITDLSTPLLAYAPSDSLYVSFRIATRPRDASAPDYFSIQLTTDCGLSYQQVYFKSTTELSMENTGTNGDFVPARRSQWRKDSVNLTPFLAQSNTFYLVFRNINNFDSNIYLDDVNVYGRNLPSKLKEDGFLIAPTITANLLMVQHYRQPTALRYIRLLNTAGQQVFQRQYNGNASSYIELHLGHLAAGTYFIQLGYTDRHVTKKIVKTP
ncbi:MAG: choice-of-anchor J domain-containing protein [Chitinophagaceae bacterium]